MYRFPIVDPSDACAVMPNTYGGKPSRDSDWIEKGEVRGVQSHMFGFP
jgi:hypothetical protein